MALAFVRGDIRYAWKGPSLLIVNTRGECAADQPLSGFYYREARFVRTLRLTINDALPWLCEIAAPSPEELALTFVHPELTEPGGGGTGQSGDDTHVDAYGIPERALDVRLSYCVRVNALEIAIAIANRARRRVAFELACALDADFADIQEALAGRRAQQAAVSARSTSTLLQLCYEHPELRYRTEVEYGPPWHVDTAGLRTALILAPQEVKTVAFRVVPIDVRQVITGGEAAAREAHLRAWRRRFTRLEVPGNTAIERVLTRNVRDVASFPLLEGMHDEWLAMQAGMPLYPAFFGRDAVTVGWQAGCVDRGDALDAALTRLGRLQSSRFDDWRDEEPGRIPYQVRTGPLARLEVNPYAAYYADYASPLMFVISLANLYAWTGDRRVLARHWDTARRILDWAQARGDLDGDGYLEYLTRSSRGTKNQGWKDSGDAIVWDDGAPVEPPIATCELQGYWYIAQELMSLLCGVMDAPGDAAAHHARALSLKERFNRDWWVEGEQCIAVALDAAKRQVRAVTSNVGHCLACGIIHRGRIPAVVGRLFAPDMFSGWGIRTLSSEHAFYDPLSYHRGSVWAVEQATIAFGLRRFGFDARMLDLAGALFDLAQLYPEDRIPECVGGYSRGDRATPGAYPRANTPQLWNASAFPLLVQTMLGLVPYAAADTLIVDPVLPSWLPEITLRGLRVGGATVALRFTRTSGGASDWDVVHKQGTLHIVRQPPIESLFAGIAQRARGVLESTVS